MSRPPTGDPGPDHWITEEGPGSSGPGRPEVDVDPATLVDASAFAIILPATDPGPPGGPPATGSDDDDRTRASVQGLGGDPGRLEIPGFRILRELGRGGMGVVYEAIELALSRRVALKVMPPQIASNGKAAERFRREARSAAKLHHTNIVPIFGVGPNEGTLYYAMQLIEGESLDRVIARLGRTSQAGGDAGRPRPSPGLDPTEMGDAPPAGPRADSPPSARPSYDRDREVARVGLQVAEALEHAHDQGILHRDIKPSNLLFDRRGVIWVTDFGLAKSFHGADDDLTNTGDFVGTLRFMAPERFSGRSEPRSDLYALGITLYELLTLRPAFAGSDRPSLLQRVLHEEPRHPRSIDRRVSRDLETVILKAMAKEPDRRYANAGDLAEDLRRFLAGETVSARRAGPAVRAWRWARRRPAAAALGLSVAVLLTTLAVVSTLAAVRIGQARDALRRTLYISRMNLAGQAWESANMGRLRELLAPYRDEAPDADLRSFEWAYWWGLAHPSRLRKSLDVHSGFVVGLAYSADGKTLATVGGDDLVRLTDWASGVARWSGPVHSPMFNKPLAWSPRGNLLATEGPEGSVLVRDSATGRVEARLDRGWEPRGARPSILAFRPDGVLIAVIDGDRAILWAPGEADFRSIMLAGASPAKSRTCQAISTDGRLLAIGDLDGGVRLWDLIDGSSRGEVLAHASAVRSLAFSADGSTLASGGQDTLIRLWDVARLAPRGEPLRGHQISPWMLDFSPDGGTLASACLDNTVRLWDVASGTPAGILKGHDSAVYCVRFAPDGRHLATAGLDRRIRIWDFEESGPPSEIAVDPVGGDTLRFLDDGRGHRLGRPRRDDQDLGYPPRGLATPHPQAGVGRRISHSDVPVREPGPGHGPQPGRREEPGRGPERRRARNLGCLGGSALEEVGHRARGDRFRGLLPGRPDPGHLGAGGQGNAPRPGHPPGVADPGGGPPLGQGPPGRLRPGWGEPAGGRPLRGPVSLGHQRLGPVVGGGGSGFGEDGGVRPPGDRAGRPDRGGRPDRRIDDALGHPHPPAPGAASRPRRAGDGRDLLARRPDPGHRQPGPDHQALGCRLRGAEDHAGRPRVERPGRRLLTRWHGPGLDRPGRDDPLLEGPV